MTESRVKFGLTLPNRGVVIGATTVAEMLQLAADAESEGWDSVWVGDSIFAKPRLDAMVLLGAIAAVPLLRGRAKRPHSLRSIAAEISDCRRQYHASFQQYHVSSSTGR